MPTQTENVKYVFEATTDNAVKGLNSLSASFKKIGNVGKDFNNALKSATSSVNLLGKAASAFSGAAIGKALASATKEAIDFYETLNLFQVAMKDSIDAGNEFIDNVSEWYGLDPKNLMEYTGLFYEMAYAVGTPAKAAQQLSTSLTALSVDLASLFNVDVERVADNLTSGIRGMSRSVVKYGMDLRASTVEAYAHTLGIKENYETMDEASREILRYLVAVNQAQDALGDFANTIPHPANQLRVFKEQMSQFGRAIGTFLVQPLKAALPIINGFVMALNVLLGTLAALMGVKLEVAEREGLGDTKDTIDSIGASADGTKKKLKALLAPFDELNVIQENNSGSGGGASLDYGEVDPLLLAALEKAQYSLEEIRMAAHDTRDAILEFFGITPSEDGWVYAPDVFERNLMQKFPKWQKTIAALFDFNYDGFLKNIQMIFGQMVSIAGNAIGIVFNDLLRLFGIDDTKLAEWISTLNADLSSLRRWLNENANQVALFVARVIELVGGFALLRAGASILSPIFSGIATAVSAIGTAFNVLAPVANSIVLTFGSFITTLGTKFPMLASIVSTVLGGIGTAFNAVFGGIATTVSGVLSGIVSALNINLYGMGLGIVGLFVAGFISGFVDIWRNSETFRANLGMLFSNIGTMLMSAFELIKNVIGLIITLVTPIVKTIGNLLQPIYPLIVDILNAVVGAITGVLDVINGILTGDLSAIFKGFMKIVMGFVETMMNLGAGIVNAVISMIVSTVNAVGRIIYGIVSAVVKAVNSVGSLLGIGTIPLPDKSLFVFEDVPKIVPPALDYGFANGGVVTGPTRALIGEAGRPEMVMPLGDSPQMNDFINKIVDKMGNSGKETVVKVYIGDREWDAFTYESAQRGKQLVGAQPVTIGG